MSIFDNDLKRLNFEDYIWVIFIVLSILNIVGDNYQKQFLESKSSNDEIRANNIFTFVLVVSFLIYLYFLIRNVNALKRSEEEAKGLFSIKTFGSVLFVVGILCLIYFQVNQNDFIGTPI